MVYDVVGLVDKKYIVDPLDSEDNLNFGYVDLDLEDYDNKDYDVDDLSEVYNSAYITPKRKKKNTNLFDVVKERLTEYLARQIVNTELVTVLGDDVDEIIKSLSNYSLEELFYMRKGLKEYEEMDNVTDQDYLQLFNVDTKGQLNFL